MVSLVRNCIPSKNTFSAILLGSGAAYVAIETAKVASRLGVACLPERAAAYVPVLYPMWPHTPLLNIIPDNCYVQTGIAVGMSTLALALAISSVSCCQANKKIKSLQQYQGVFTASEDSKSPRLKNE